jgi:hypothetical protein
MAIFSSYPISVETGTAVPQQESSSIGSRRITQSMHTSFDDASTAAFVLAGRLGEDTTLMNKSLAYVNFTAHVLPQLFGALLCPSQIS